MRKSGNGLYCAECRRIKLREWMNASISRNRDHYRDKNRATAIKLRKKEKLLVVHHYSDGTGRCACCGEEKLEFLTLDHIGNDGAKERRKTKSWPGSSFYYWLIKQGLPAGYQVLCSNCNMSKAKRGRCVHNLGSVNENRRLSQALLRREKTKREVLGHYSGQLFKCACCGEPEIDFLTVDHISGNAKQQKDWHGTPRSGNALYLWLVRNRFPTGFQVLCMNCNCAKGRHGVCPHVA